MIIDVKNPYCWDNAVILYIFFSFRFDFFLFFFFPLFLLFIFLALFLLFLISILLFLYLLFLIIILLFLFIILVFLFIILFALNLSLFTMLHYIKRSSKREETLIQPSIRFWFQITIFDVNLIECNCLQIKFINCSLHVELFTFLTIFAIIGFLLMQNMLLF